MTPRGIRNNNPGNIRIGDNWQGLAPEQTDGAFCQFKTPFWGLRALGKVLLNYQRKVGLTTIKQMIGRWAPPVENDTGAYVRVVAAAVGVEPTASLRLEHELDRFVAMVTAIVKHENGQQPYSTALIRSACRSALGQAITPE